ncbi:Aste57867_9434 [Aphanomyces stellatus]|uniref:Aste57867_9434 protein n=1 Tax=Aphanomyces stellatus TaxID=120398 RepID=A0A485KN88_9STRA|nr:hypothetical protein As57867_009398 [Aphanomyces stellatus]VFT86314.1 Aste57867_9434 [Aphanomyces stellatus]
MSLLTSLKSTFQKDKADEARDPSVDLFGEGRADLAPGGVVVATSVVEDTTSKTGSTIQANLDVIRKQLTMMGATALEFIDPKKDTKEDKTTQDAAPQDSPPTEHHRRRRSLIQSLGLDEISKVLVPDKDAPNDRVAQNTEVQQEPSPPAAEGRRRWMVLPKFTTTEKSKDRSVSCAAADEVIMQQQEPSPPSGRRHWSLMPTFTVDDLKLTKPDLDKSASTPSDPASREPSPTNKSDVGGGHRRRWSIIMSKTPDEFKPSNGDESSLDAPQSPQQQQQQQGQGSPLHDPTSVSTIQSDAQRVCSVLSGDAKRHLKILKGIDPTSVVVTDVKKAIAEANIWLRQCIAPTDSGDAPCIKEAKLNQRRHAERCLMDANVLALTEIKRLSDRATTNATYDGDILPIHPPTLPPRSHHLRTPSQGK